MVFVLFSIISMSLNVGHGPELLQSIALNATVPKSARGYLPPPGRSTIHSAVPRQQTTEGLHSCAVVKLLPVVTTYTLRT